MRRRDKPSFKWRRREKYSIFFHEFKTSVTISLLTRFQSSWSLSCCQLSELFESGLFNLGNSTFPPGPTHSLLVGGGGCRNPSGCDGTNLRSNPFFVKENYLKKLQKYVFRVKMVKISTKIFDPTFFGRRIFPIGQKINDRLAMAIRSFLEAFPVRATEGEVLQYFGPTPIVAQYFLCFGLIV